MKCRNCGATLDEGALFCRKCGTAVPKAPDPEQKRQKKQTKKKTVLSGITDRLSDWFGRVGKWFSGTYAQIRNWLNGLKDTKLFKNKRLLMLTGAGAALLLVLIIVIVSVASCKKPERYQTPDELTAAVIDALNTGDGETLYEMSKLSRKVLGEHTEIFGAGDTPEAVMKGYYERLAGDLHTQLSERYGEGYRLEGQPETKRITDTSIFETNRMLGLEAAQYAEIDGPLSVGGEKVTNVHIVAVELDGEWKLIVVYIY